MPVPVNVARKREIASLVNEAIVVVVKPAQKRSLGKSNENTSRLDRTCYSHRCSSAPSFLKALVSWKCNEANQLGGYKLNLVLMEMF